MRSQVNDIGLLLTPGESPYKQHRGKEDWQADHNSVDRSFELLVSPSLTFVGYEGGLQAIAGSETAQMK